MTDKQLLTALSHTLTRQDIHKTYGWSRYMVYRRIKNHGDFPTPIINIGGVSFWNRSAIEAYFNGAK